MTRRLPQTEPTVALVQRARSGDAEAYDELFVRATVTSTLPVDNPVWEGQLRQAWTQPVR